VTDVMSRIDSKYFADSMTEELITGLGKIHSLRVISRQPEMQYMGIQPGLRCLASPRPRPQETHLYPFLFPTVCCAFARMKA